MSLLLINELNTERPINKPLSNFPTIEDDQKIMLKTEEGFSVIAINEIAHIASYGPYVKVFDRNQDYIFSRIGINRIEELTLHFPFLVRCHRSYIININSVKKVCLQNTMSIELENKVTIPIAKRRKSIIQDAFNNHFITINDSF